MISQAHCIPSHVYPQLHSYNIPLRDMDKCLYILDSVLAIDHEMIPFKFDVVNQCLPEFIRVLYGSMNDSRASQNHSETQPRTQNKS